MHNGLNTIKTIIPSHKDIDQNSNVFDLADTLIIRIFKSQTNVY